MIITLSGLTGTGTTSVAKKLKEELGYEYIYAGQILRDEAERRGMSLLEFDKYLVDHLEFDKELDKKVVEFGRTHPNSILEGRISAWMVDKEGLSALKILLTVSLDLAAERIFQRDNLSIEEAKNKISERDTVIFGRYKELYDIDPSDTSVYDHIIDTSKYSVDEEVEIIRALMKDKLG